MAKLTLNISEIDFLQRIIKDINGNYFSATKHTHLFTFYAKVIHFYCEITEQALIEIKEEQTKALFVSKEIKTQ
ncbi:MAG: hypothetical protein L3J53_02575 [Proteobacteria bacterium]|nr:hypothetical protein [Pseudomonadota bacterium]